MKIKDTELLLASHARLIATAQLLADKSRKSSKPADALRQALNDARKVRTDIGRPL